MQAVASGAYANAALSSSRRPLDYGPMPATAPVRRLIEAEYLDFERKADVKHEFFDGEVSACVEFKPTPVRPAGV